jgi:hypothetical protein
MADADPQGNGARPTPVSAEPPPLARLLAVLAIVVAGACGGLIGYAVTDLSCEGDCTAASAGVGVVSAVGAAVGVAVVAVLALRAMGEWNATPPELRQARRRQR